MVIFNHTNERGFSRYVIDNPSTLTWSLNLIFSIFCKSAVPIFFMISGSLLLRKDESLIKTLKRVPKIFFDLLFFSIAYFWTDAKIAGVPFSIEDTFQIMLQSNYWHLWYLYAYLAFLLTLPFLRKMVYLLDEKTSIYMFVIAGIFMGVLPIIEYFGAIGINGNLKPYWLTATVFIYPVTGYVIDCKIEILKIKKHLLLGVWGIDILCLIIGEICEYHYLLREPGNNNEMFLTNFCLVNSIAIFMTVKFLFSSNNLNTNLCTIITEVGKCTFGIYLLHIWFLWKIPFFYNFEIKLEQTFSYGVFISCFLVFMVAGSITFGLRKIPFVKLLF